MVVGVAGGDGEPNQQFQFSRSRGGEEGKKGVRNPPRTPRNMATPGLEIYAVERHVPVVELAGLLKLGPDVPTTELSAVEWGDRETVIDELATFFPFPRYFNREWDAVPGAVAEQVEKGRLILVRGLSSEGLQHLGLLIDYAAAALGRPGKVQGACVRARKEPRPRHTHTQPGLTPCLEWN